jgi:diaminopropionate ammonia-lyase
VPDEVRLLVNPAAAPREAPYRARHADTLDPAGFDAAWSAIRRWPGYAPTPLVSLAGRAKALGIAGLDYKDEGRRFGLGSFKALGGPYAVARVIQREMARRGLPSPSIDDLVAGRCRAEVADITVTSATDGNHGRAVAWGARLLGCRAVIFIHETVSEGRKMAIEAYGAEVRRVPGGYDDSVRRAFATAAAQGWHVVQDTATPDYRDVPADIGYGYGVITKEIVAAITEPPTHVIVQAGVGGLASAVCAVLWEAWGPRRPRCIVLEPVTADCVYRSLAAGAPTVVPGNADSFMAGLSCGEISLIAWEILRDGADAALAIGDDLAREGMRALATPVAGDPAIVGGECSGGAIGALLALARRPDLAAALQIGPASRVVVIGTEGATDPAIYEATVGRPPATVAAVT